MIKQRTLYRLTSCRVCFHPRTSQPKYILGVGFSSQSSKHGGRKWHLVTKKWQLLASGQNVFQWVLTRLGFNAFFDFFCHSLYPVKPDLVPKSKLSPFANIECLLHAWILLLYTPGAWIMLWTRSKPAKVVKTLEFWEKLITAEIFNVRAQ